MMEAEGDAASARAAARAVGCVADDTHTHTHTHVHSSCIHISTCIFYDYNYCCTQSNSFSPCFEGIKRYRVLAPTRCIFSRYNTPRSTGTVKRL